MRFVKMHGLGNDYVYVNAFQEDVADPPALARRIADRHFGVGGDGLILVTPADPGVDAHVRMRMFNADGSESEMCGNGVRCVCKLAHDHNLVAGIRDANPMRVQTGRGVLNLGYTLGPDGKVDQVSVDMGPPVLTPADIPVRLAPLERVVNHPISGLFDWPDQVQGWDKAAGLDPRLTCVSMGNPHAVLYCQHVDKVPLEVVGPIIERHALFPRRVNVHFASVQAAGEARMRTWERGSGVTLACGTGASAVCVAGVLTGRTGRRLLAHLPGGDLSLEWRAADQHIIMTGPAVEVFSGQWPDG